MENKTNKPSFVLSFFTFVGVAAIISYGLMGLGLDAHVPLACAATLAALIGKYVVGIEWAKMEESVFASISSAMSALLILFTIGMLVGSWVLSGVVPGMIYYGLNLLTPGSFLLATLLLCSIVSVATGSSWGVGGTVGVALIGIAAGLGIPAPLTAGVIISGAYFGDKMSPLSDTTNLAPAVSGSNLFDHIRAMMWTTIPSYLIVIAITIYLGTHYSGAAANFDSSRIQAMQAFLSKEFTINPYYTAIPPLIILVLALIKYPAIPSMIAGTAAASVISLTQGYSLYDVLNVIHHGYTSTTSALFSEASLEGVPEILTKLGITNLDSSAALEAGKLLTKLLNRGGIESMMWSLSLIVIALVLGGIMERCSYLEVLLTPLLRKVKTVGGFVSLVAAACFSGNFFLGDQYLGIVVPGRMFKTVVARTDLSPRMLSRTLEDCATMTAVLIPWTGCGAFQSAALGVATLDYIPYCFLNYLNPIVAILMTYMGIGIYWGKNGADKVERRTALSFDFTKEVHEA